MPTHDIDVTVPAQMIKNKDMEITVRADGFVFGRLKVSKGSIDWVPAHSDITRRLSWEAFDRVMDERGRKVRPRS